MNSSYFRYFDYDDFFLLDISSYAVFVGLLGSNVLTNNILLRGSHLTRSFLKENSVEQQYRMPNDIDFLFYMPCDVVDAENYRFDYERYSKPSTEYITAFETKIKQLVECLKKLSVSLNLQVAADFYAKKQLLDLKFHVIVYFSDFELIRTFPEELYPSTKIVFQVSFY